MRRRELIALAGAAGVAGVTSLAGCAPKGGQSPPPVVDGPASAGAIPSSGLNPSLGPSPAPIPAGLRVDGEALLVVFGKLSDGTPDVDTVWYDPTTAAIVTGPASMAAWPAQAQGAGFQKTVAAADREGRIVLYGWVLGPVEKVWMEWRGARLPATLVAWPANPACKAFWLRAGDYAPAAVVPAPPSPSASPVYVAASLVAADAGGKPVYTLPLAPGR
jgi:hypothetical protein